MPDDPAGSHQDYGFYHDTMGTTWRKPLNELQFNAHFKNLLDWIPDNQIKEVNGNYTGRIYASDQSLVANRDYAIRINSNRSLGGKSNLDYYIEYRSLFSDNPGISNGALVYLSDASGSNQSTSCWI